MNTRKIIERVDTAQQQHTGSAFLVGVVKKYGDDNGGNLAALLAYYGFLSLFPLMLVAVTVLGYVLAGHPELQKDVVHSALADFPVIGSQIERNVTSLHGSAFALAIGLLGTFWGGLGIAHAAQHAMNRIWDVPIAARPGFLPRMVRSLGVIAVIGLGVLTTTAIGTVGGQLSQLGIVGKILVEVVVIALQIALFVVAFNMLTSAEIGWRAHVAGAIPAGIAFQLLATFGGIYINHGMRGMSQTYGLFAIVIGLLTWIYLQAQIVLFAAEINVVRHRHLWPRSLVKPPATGADRQADIDATVAEARVDPSVVREAARTAPGESAPSESGDGSRDGAEPARMHPVGRG